MKASLIRLPCAQRVVLGANAVEAIVSEVDRLGARRAFALISGHVDTATDMTGQLRRQLGERFAGHFSGIKPHVPKGDVLRVGESARAAGADMLIAIGGGSVVDAAKVALLCIEHGLTTREDLERYRAQFRADGTAVEANWPPVTTPLIAVPTTLSGGEFNSLAGVTDETTQRKQGFEHRSLAPMTVILDPAITVHTPMWLWNSTGVRAVDHAVETLASGLSNPFWDGFAMSALALLSEALPKVQRNPDDLEARLRCQIGASHAILPMVSGVPMGASHAIGHLLGAVAGVPHGYTSCVMAPCVQAWNAEVSNPRLALISRALGSPDAPVHELLDGLIRGLGMPRTLEDVGVRPEQWSAVAEGTLLDIWGGTNPRPINGVPDVLELLSRASSNQSKKDHS